MTETYQALAEESRRKIRQEWDCCASESVLLALIVDLSYEIGQSWCVVPSLADFAEACGIHKSTASRALRRAVTKGRLEILQRQGETLYRLITTAPATCAAKANEQSMKRARNRLLVMNQTRLQGRADPDGQSRLPGVFDSEEIEAPAAAFKAIVSTPEKPGPEDPLNKLLRTMQRLNPSSEDERPENIKPEDTRTTSQRMTVGSFDSQWHELTRNLSDQVVFCLEQIRAECQQRKGGEAEFFQWRWKWRQRAQKDTRLYLEAAGICKAMRLESGTVAESPGAFIYRSVEQAKKVVS